LTLNPMRLGYCRSFALTETRTNEDSDRDTSSETKRPKL
jgi:hypothetical protein